MGNLETNLNIRLDEETLQWLRANAKPWAGHGKDAGGYGWIVREALREYRAKVEQQAKLEIVQAENK